MEWKKLFWYCLTLLLFSFLIYYITKSCIELVTVFSTYTMSWKYILGLIANVFILLIEILSTFFSIFIYYYIGSSSSYKIIKDEKNVYLTKTPLPKITIAIPLYKEPLAVVSKTLEGAMNLNYPKDRFEIIVCDDSPGKNIGEIEEYCNQNNILFIKRDNRKGFKAGALNNVLRQVECDFFAVLDSDHIPTPNFIRTCLSGFVEEDIILVQGKPMFVNQDDYLMRSSAFIHTQFFHIYQKSRGTRNGVIFAGTTGMFRADLLKNSGGFLEDTLAEDTDTSFMLMSQGYKTRYIHEICSKGLVPWNPISMINQVWRWTNGITSIFRKRFWKIVRGKNSFINKVDIFSTIVTPIIGITIWSVYALLFIMYMLREFAGMNEFNFVRPFLGTFPLLLIAPLLISFASLIMAFIAWLREGKEDRMIKLRGIFGMVWTIGAFYLLMMTAQSFLVWAVLSALLGVRKDFDRTVKVKTKQIGRMSQKLKYTVWSFFLLALAGAFYYVSYLTAFTVTPMDPLFGWFIVAAVTATIPIVITLTNFRKLELMKLFAATKTADEVEKEYEVMK